VKQGKRPGCLLLHGFTGTPQVFDEIRQSLDQAGFISRAPLLPGHGGDPDDMSTVLWQDWLSAAEDELYNFKNECEQLFLMGYSVGGALAITLAAKNPVAGLIVLSAPFRLPLHTTLAVRLLRYIVPCWPKRPLPPGMEGMREHEYDCYPSAGVRQCVLLLKDMRKRISSVSCPTRILHAEGDQRVNTKNAGKIFRHLQISDKKMIILGNTCHTVLKGGDKLFVRDYILRFISGDEADS